MKSIVRTSDRINFKSCREAWNFGSKIRLNYEPISLPKPLDFGTAIHSGMEIIYEPKTWSWLQDPLKAALVRSATIETFQETNGSALLRYEEARGPDELVRIDFAERDVLGTAMLNNYLDWIISVKEWETFTPVYSEIEFQVPIPVPKDSRGVFFSVQERLDNFGISPEGYLTYFDFAADEYVLVYYQGRIDSIWQDKLGRYWIVDHKTAGQMREDVIAFLEMDEQMKSYGWAIEKMLGIKIAGIIYNELYKGSPNPPKQNSNLRLGRWFSVAKNQDTSYALYLETVKEQDPKAYEAGLYGEMLDYLLNQGNKYFRRTQVSYTPYEYEQLGYQICLEALDMLGDPLIYPNPSRFKCGYCMFRKPCLAKMDGSDVKFILDQLYTQRETRQTESPFSKDPQEEEFQ